MVDDEEKNDIMEGVNNFAKTKDGKQVRKYLDEHTSEILMIIASDAKLFMDFMAKLGAVIHVSTNASEVSFEFTSNKVDGIVYEGNYSYKPKEKAQGK